MSKHDKPAPATEAITPPPATQALEVFDYGDDAGGGFENQTGDDRKLPIIMVVQSNSKVVKERKALPGQLWNTLTETAHDFVDFVAAITDHSMVEWRPIDDGGGFRGRHKLDDKIVKDAIARAGKRVGKLPVPQPADTKGKPQPDNELIETYEIYSIVVEGDEPVGMAMIPCSSMKIRPYRDWNTQLSMFQIKGADGRKHTVPLFAHLVRMTTVEGPPKPGGAYYVPVFSPAKGADLRSSLLLATDARYLAAKQLREQYHAGVVRAAYESTVNEGGGSGGGGDAAAEPAF